jgi:hypothetical protein
MGRGNCCSIEGCGRRSAQHPCRFFRASQPSDHNCHGRGLSCALSWIESVRPRPVARPGDPSESRPSESSVGLRCIGVRGRVRVGVILSIQILTVQIQLEVGLNQ